MNTEATSSAAKDQTLDGLSYKNYDHPDDVLADSNLSKKQKIMVLKNWAEVEEQIAQASAEGLNGGEDTHLKSVRAALLTLTEDPDNI